MKLALSPWGWTKRQARTIFGNAQSIRDYRAQLRSTRTIWLWAAYLALLILLAMSFYSATIGTGQQSVAQLQGQLWSLYGTLISMLGWIILIFSPALTAFTIFQERDRKSLDLIFSAPVEPKYLLVGKMLSSYRYIWMLLILALPVTSMCVVMGGATWMDVLGAYVALSAMGLVVTSIGLLISSLAGSVASALVSTYVAVGGYFIVLAEIVSEIMMGSMGAMRGSTANEAPFVMVMQPIELGSSVQTTTALFGVAVPNWILALAVSLLVSRIFLLGAGSALSPYGSPDTKGLRIYGLIYIAVLGYILGKGISGMGMMMSSMGSSGGTTKIGAVLLAWLAVPLLIVFPHLCCHHPGADSKYRSTKIHGFRAAFVGNPDGALLYIALLLAAYLGAATLGATSGGFRAPEGLMDATLWLAAFFFFWWAVGRYTSAVGKSLRSARVWHIGLILACLPGGLAILALLETSRGFTGEYTPGFVAIHPMYPLLNAEHMEGALAHSLAMGVLGFLILFVAEERSWQRRKLGEELRQTEFFAPRAPIEESLERPNVAES